MDENAVLVICFSVHYSRESFGNVFIFGAATGVRIGLHARNAGHVRSVVETICFCLAFSCRLNVWIGSHRVGEGLQGGIRKA